MLRARKIDKCKPGVSCQSAGVFKMHESFWIKYPLQRPLSSNVPIRIFRIQASFTPSLLAGSDGTVSLFASLARCASKRPLIDSTVVSNPRLPKKSVGAGGCFCAERTFCANLDWPLPRVSMPSRDVPSFTGRPSKLPPVSYFKKSRTTERNNE